MRKHNRKILLALSDIHAGFKLALMNPTVELYNEKAGGKSEEPEAYTPKMTSSQEMLWEIYTKQLSELRKIAGRDEIHVIHNGDLTDGTRHQSDLVSDRPSDQVLIGVANLQPLLDIPNIKSLRVVVGTQAHNMGLGSSEMMAAELLKKMYPDKKIKVLYHGLLDMDGVLVDYAHHGGHPGTRLWLSGNVHRLYIRDLMMQDIVAGKKPPRVVLRGHYHQYQMIYEQMGEYETTSVITPSYCMLSDYNHQATRSAGTVTNGMVAFEILDGKLGQIYPLIKKTDTRTIEKL